MWKYLVLYIDVDIDIDIAPQLPSAGGSATLASGAKGDGGAEKCICVYTYIYVCKDG